MKNKSKYLALIILSTFSYSVTTAQRIDLSSEQKGKFISRHNDWRKQFGTPNVTWSDSLAAYAQVWVDSLYKDSCDYRHRDEGLYGENIWASSSKKVDVIEIVDTWAEEKNNYHGEALIGYNYQLFGHYTQVVWENTTEIGCAVAICSNGVICVCNYNPPGNMSGESPKRKSAK